MRLLIIMVGIPGSGKSTLIKNNNVQDLVICPDEVRKMYAGIMPHNNQDGYSLKYDSLVWKTIHQMLEVRLELGQTTILDSTGLYDLSKIKKLAKMFRYRICYCVIDNVSASECYKRIQNRDHNQMIKEEVCYKYEKRLYDKFNKKQSDVFRASEFSDPLKEALKWNSLYLQDFNEYKEIKVIPDIHGQFDTLNQIDFTSIDTHYVFLGDYIDRGTKSLETLRFVLSHIDNPNFTFLVGNHELRLFYYAFEREVNYPTRFKELASQLTEQDIKQLRNKANKFKSYLYIKFKDELYFFNHSGVDKLYDNMPDSYLTGKITYGYENENSYLDYVKVGEKWKENHPNITQIFGHRNVYQLNEGTINGRAFCIECNVENGDDLKVMVLPTLRFETYKNTQTNLVDYTDSETIDENIRKKYFYNEGVYSINFSHNVFFKKIWNEITIKARGLYRYCDSNEIAGRSYDKFFNLNEMKETELETWSNSVKYPIKVWEKENGYLGILFFNRYTNDLTFATKSVACGGPLNKAFENMFTEQEKQILADYCFTYNRSIVFEVISNVDNEHPIKYNDEKVVVLEIFNNDEREKTYSLDELKQELNDEKSKIKFKKLAHTIYNKDDFISFVRDLENNYELDIEGYVFESTDTQRVKFKTNFYNIKKILRSLYSNDKKCEGLKHKDRKIILELYKKFSKETWREININNLQVAIQECI